MRPTLTFWREEREKKREREKLTERGRGCYILFSIYISIYLLLLVMGVRIG